MPKGKTLEASPSVLAALLGTTIVGSRADELLSAMKQSATQKLRVHKLGRKQDLIFVRWQREKRNPNCQSRIRSLPASNSARLTKRFAIPCTLMAQPERVSTRATSIVGI